MLQYKIPQDVQIADKILGPLTLKQLLIVAAGGGISYLIFLIMSDYYIFNYFDYFWICIPLLLSLAFAFLKINDVTFLKWLLLLYEFNRNARIRRWDKSETARLHFAFTTAKTGTIKKGAKKKAKKKKGVPGRKNFSSLEEITHMLDHHSPFQEKEKHLPTDHTADDALHLTAEEKDRHEKRISQIMKASASTPRQKKKASAKSQKQKVTNRPQKTKNKNEKQETKEKGDQKKSFSFKDLQKGGSVSFS